MRESKTLTIYVCFGDITPYFEFTNNYNDDFKYPNLSGKILKIDAVYIDKDVIANINSNLDLNNSEQVLSFIRNNPPLGTSFVISYRRKYTDNYTCESYYLSKNELLQMVLNRAFMRKLNINLTQHTEEEYLNNKNSITIDNFEKISEKHSLVADIVIKHRSSTRAKLSQADIYTIVLDDDFKLSEEVTYCPVGLVPSVGMDNPLFVRVVKCGNVLLIDYLKGQRSITSCSTINIHLLNNLVSLKDFQDGVFLKNRLRSIMYGTRSAILNISSQERMYDRVMDPLIYGDLKFTELRNIPNLNSGNLVFTTLFYR